jgi:hypothetical protein
VVAQKVEGDRVDPRLDPCPWAVVAPPGAQSVLEGIGEQVLGEDPVAGAVGEKGEQRLCVLGVEALKIDVAHLLQSLGQGRDGSSV